VTPEEISQLSLNFQMRHDLQGEFRNVLAHWTIDVISTTEDPSAFYGLRETIVGSIDIFDATIGHPALYEALDSYSMDLTRVADALVVPSSGELKEQVEERLEFVGGHLLVLNEVRLDEDWRGSGLGALLAGEALVALSCGAQLAATVPGSLPDPPGHDGPKKTAIEVRQATTKLEQVWMQIGFEALADGVWIVDLAMNHLYERVNALRARHDLQEQP